MLRLFKICQIPKNIFEQFLLPKERFLKYISQVE